MLISVVLIVTPGLTAVGQALAVVIAFMLCMLFFADRGLSLNRAGFRD